MTKAFLLFLVAFLAVPVSVLAQDSFCNTNITKRNEYSDPQTRYQYRGNRCEGIYSKTNSGSGIKLIGVLYGRLTYQLTTDEVVRVTVPMSDATKVRVRAEKAALTTCYQMDSEINHGDTLNWNIADVIEKKKIKPNELGLLGFTVDTIVGRTYIPLKTDPVLDSLYNDDRLRLTFRSISDLENIEYRWYAATTTKKPKWKVMRGFFPAGDAIIISIVPEKDEELPALFEVEIRGIKKFVGRGKKEESKYLIRTKSSISP